MDLTEGPTAIKCINAFREFDHTGGGSIAQTDLLAALQKAGLQVSVRELRRHLVESGGEVSTEVSYAEFARLHKHVGSVVNAAVKATTALRASFSAKNTVKLNRACFSAQQYASYEADFLELSGGAAFIGVEQLKAYALKAEAGLTMAKLQQLVAEVDDDSSGALDFSEFLGILIKALNLKRQKVGPGSGVSLRDLLAEGWSLGELRKVGYECTDFLQAGYAHAELSEYFNASELRRAGASARCLVEAGWDCHGARQGGIALAELLSCGVSIRKLRSVGWSDRGSAIALRKLGVSAADMRQGGFSLGDLRAAGYSLADLRTAGLSCRAMTSMQKVQSQKAGLPPMERQTTRDIRAQLEEVIQGDPHETVKTPNGSATNAE